MTQLPGSVKNLKTELNIFSFETTWPFSTKFHVNPTVEMVLRVCSNGLALLTVMLIYGKK